MCHSNLDIDLERHSKLFRWDKKVSTRLFSVSPGVGYVKLPEGFGIPLMSDETIFLTSQVLNHNIDKANFQVRQQMDVEYVRDVDLKTPMKPLYMQSLESMALVEGSEAYYDVAHPDKEKHGPGCMMGETASPQSNIQDPFGRIFTGHWIVKPGRQVNHTLVTKLLALPFDTTVHYMTVHVHPFAESIELKDLTNGEVIFHSNVVNFKDRIGIESVDSFSIKEGKPLYKDHEYELVSVYNNTSGTDQDAMAVAFLYLLDKEFKRPALAWEEK